MQTLKSQVLDLARREFHKRSLDSMWLRAKIFVEVQLTMRRMYFDQINPKANRTFRAVNERLFNTCQTCEV